MSCRAALVLPALLAACGWSTVEDQVLSTFFEASRLCDTTRVADVATVMFEPRVDGSVQRFAIERDDQEHHRPFDRATDEAFAVNSLTPAGQPDVALAGLDVEIIEKQMAVKADVERPDGHLDTPVLEVTLRRAIARRGDHAIQGRWLVTAVRPRAD